MTYISERGKRSKKGKKAAQIRWRTAYLWTPLSLHLSAPNKTITGIKRRASSLLSFSFSFLSVLRPTRLSRYSSPFSKTRNFKTSLVPMNRMLAFQGSWSLRLPQLLFFNVSKGRQCLISSFLLLLLNLLKDDHNYKLKWEKGLNSDVIKKKLEKVRSTSIL